MAKLLDSLSFVIPVYNDETTIGSLVGEVVEVGKKISHKFEIVVANDASSDGTADVLVNLKKKLSNLRVITHDQNSGYGQTIRELYRAAKYNWIFSLPGDYQISPREINKLLPYCHQAEMILGWRKRRQDPRGRLIQSLIYNLLLKLLFGLDLHDVNSVRLLKKSALAKIRLTCTSAFVDAQLAIELKDKNMKILEIPINHKPRDSEGASGGKWKTIWATIKEMVRFYYEKKYQRT